MLCNSCGKQKNHLNRKKSAVMPGITLLICDSCVEAKFEPRWVIILAGRQKGIGQVREYVIKKRYYGEPIIASELVV